MRLNRGNWQNIRSDLSANSEKRPERQHDPVNFGIYRLLSSESVYLLASSTQDGLEESLPSVIGERSKRGKDIGKFTINTVMAGTFVRRAAIGRKSLELMKAGFSIARDIKPIGIEIAQGGYVDAPLPLLLDSVHWDNKGSGRKLVVELDTSDEEYTTLKRDADIIARHLPDSVRVCTPDHITLGQYGKQDDGLRLSERHKNRIAESVSGQLYTNGPSMITFGDLQIGKSYSESLKEWRTAHYIIEALINNASSGENIVIPVEAVG